ncbi:MAG: hypothetical protein U0798_14940 [Gemmataceae bacterium]
MGSISFQLSPQERKAFKPADLYFAGGYDLAPVPVDIQLTADGFVLNRPDNDSGFVIYHWTDAKVGTIVANTATLRQRPEPYRLSIELARGKLNAVRNQTAEWSEIGLELPVLYKEKLSAVGKLFGRTVVSDNVSKLDADAYEILRESHVLSNELVELYTDQVFRTRHHSETRIRTAFGCQLHNEPPETSLDETYRTAFNAVRLKPNWRKMEAAQGEFDWSHFDRLVGWALTAGLNVSIGPIIDLRPNNLPDWIEEWKGDWPSIAAYACEFAELVMVRYGERVGVWEVISGFNHADAMGLNEDDRLRLAARLLDAARQIDKEGELVFGLTQPWGEYRRDPGAIYSPLLFADTLLRAGIRASAFVLDISESGPASSPARDALDVVRLLDSFGVLGLQLELLMSSPTNGTPEATARAARIAAVAACMPHVKGCFWRDWSEAETGLVGRPLLQKFENLRTSHLA